MMNIGNLNRALLLLTVGILVVAVIGCADGTDSGAGENSNSAAQSDSDTHPVDDHAGMAIKEFPTELQSAGAETAVVDVWTEFLTNTYFDPHGNGDFHHFCENGVIESESLSGSDTYVTGSLDAWSIELPSVAISAQLGETALQLEPIVHAGQGFSTSIALTVEDNKPILTNAGIAAPLTAYESDYCLHVVNPSTDSPLTGTGTHVSAELLDVASDRTRTGDIVALDALVRKQGKFHQEFIDGRFSVNESSWDSEPFYETCHPELRQSAKEANVINRLFRVLDSDVTSIEYVTEEISFIGGASAVVTAGGRSNFHYSPGFSGGTYQKEGDEWFSMSWGCVG